MKTIIRTLLVATAIIGSMATVAANAATLTTTAPLAGTTTTFTSTGYTNSSVATTATINGIVVTGANGFSYGNTGYGLVANGSWLNGFSFVATDDPTRLVTFDLGGSFGSVGGFLNYAPGYGSNPVITALNSAMAVIGSYDLSVLAPIVTPSGQNAGAYRGIESAGGDIRYFQISGSYLLAHSVTTAAVAAVPEPATWAMMLVGFGMMGASMRYRRRSTKAVYA
jgi:hypothetical protein